MKLVQWFKLLSRRQKLILYMTLILGTLIILFGFWNTDDTQTHDTIEFTTSMSIKEIAPQLGVTGKALARELNLPLDVGKRKPLYKLGVTSDELSHVVHHLLSHVDATAKYYIFFVIVIFGLIYLTILGRPGNASLNHKNTWYPQLPYIIFLLISLIFAGFYLGKSPNPMEGVVKVFKSTVGLYPDPGFKLLAFLFFVMLAVVGNKLICGWACPFGALQELIYSIPILRKLKKRKLPFALTNSIRVGLFIIMLLLLFGIVGGRRGFVIYHYMNPFNLFNMDFDHIFILITVVVIVIASFMTYRPFCQFICPFGLISWILERLSITRVQIDMETCTRCGACVNACPTDATKGMLADDPLAADCFSCARCLNVCPVDAIKYESIFKKKKNREESAN